MIAILSVLTALLILWHERRHPTIASDLNTVGWLTALTAALAAVGTTASTVGSSVLSGLGSIGSAIGSTAGTLGTGIANTFGSAAEIAAPVVQSVGPVAAQVGETAAQTLPQVLPTTTQALENFLPTASQAGPSLLQQIPEAIGHGTQLTSLGGQAVETIGPQAPSLIPPGATPASLLAPQPGLLSQIGSGIVDFVTEHPLTTVGATAQSYKLLRDQFKQPQATALSARERPAPLQTPNFGAQVNRAIASPLDRFRSVLGGR